MTRWQRGRTPRTWCLLLFLAFLLSVSGCAGTQGHRGGLGQQTLRSPPGPSSALGVYVCSDGSPSLLHCVVPVLLQKGSPTLPRPNLQLSDLESCKLTLKHGEVLSRNGNVFICGSTLDFQSYQSHLNALKKNWHPHVFLVDRLD